MKCGSPARWAHACLFMDGGRVIEDTSPEAFFTRPATDRARDFLTRVDERQHSAVV